ncbi:MAG: hypothetical protein JSW63_03380 [Ignavibacterium sp.]|nr:MAG: hypothetical protein JSW63_03380 [Ignavibacterium sp.]
MSNQAKQILVEMNQPPYEVLRDEFSVYLREIEQRDNLSKLTGLINWKPFIKLFDTEYIKLWKKMGIPDDLKELKILKSEFKRLVFASIKKRLFHFTYLFLKNKAKNNNVNAVDLNNSLTELFENGIYELFRVYDYQFTLSSLNKSNDSKIIVKQIEELRKKGKSEKILTGNNQHGEEAKMFKKIDEQLLKNEKEGKRWSARAVCDYYASNELNYGKGKANQGELDDFFKRYQEHRKSQVDTLPFR